MSIYLCQNDLCNNEVQSSKYKSGNYYVPKSCSNTCRQILREQNIDQDAKRVKCREYQKKRWPKFKKSDKYKSYIDGVKQVIKTSLHNPKTKEKAANNHRLTISKMSDDKRLMTFSRYYTMEEYAINRLNEKGAKHLIENWSMSMRYKKENRGMFNPKNPEKYAGDPKRIVYRSSWEKKFCIYCDTNSDIIYWASEELAIPYINPIDRKRHRYYPDFIIKTSKGKRYMIEIKPFAQTKKPTPKIKKSKAFMRESLEYIKNVAKWQAADVYCNDNDLEFKIFTEKELGIY